MDWDLFIKILSPTIAVFIGFIINKYFENKPKLITFISQTFAITMSPVNEGEDPFVVHTHSLVVRNVGRKPSNNVRICHLVLPNFQIFPHIQYEIVNLDNGVKEVLIPKLVPKEQITINYLYYPPVIWSNVHSHVKSDEGYAKYENVLLKKEYSKGIKFVSILIFIVGLSTIIYGLIVFIKNLIK